MARAVGEHRGAAKPTSAPDERQFHELATRLEALRDVQTKARTAIGDADYAAASEYLFAAVALLNPANAAQEIRKMPEFVPSGV